MPKRFTKEQSLAALREIIEEQKAKQPVKKEKPKKEKYDPNNWQEVLKKIKE